MRANRDNHLGRQAGPGTWTKKEQKAQLAAGTQKDINLGDALHNLPRSSTVPAICDYIKVRFVMELF